MIYSSKVPTIGAAFVLAYIIGSAVVGLIYEPKTPLLAWTALVVGAVAVLVVFATRRSPKRDAVLFLICGLGGAVFAGASTIGFPGFLPVGTHR